MAIALNEYDGKLLHSTSSTISVDSISAQVPDIDNNNYEEAQVIDVDDQDYEDDDNLPNIKPLTSSQQRQIFVTEFMPNKCPKDITSLISDKWLDPQFKWSLGLLEWRPYSPKTTKIVAETYGSNSNTLALINYGISKCMTHKQFDIISIRKDIMETSPNKSWLVYFIMKSIFPNLQKGVELYREKWKIHNMLYQIVSTRQGSFISPTHSYSRDIRVMALQCIPSPPMGFELQSSISMTMVSMSSMSPLSLPHIMNDIDVDDIDSSFILDTMTHEYPERDETDTRRLQNLLLAFNRIPSTNEIQYISMDIDQLQGQGMKERLRLLQAESACMMNLIPHNKPYIISKMIDIMNRKGVIMNIINLFTELRMASHYIEMFKRSHNEYIMDMDCDDSEERLPLEPFGMYENVLTISEFLRNYPLFETLRSRLKYDYIIHCISSTVTHIVNKVMRPLPFQPTHVINDSYTDFLMYTSQISRFIYNKIVNQNRFNKFKYLDDIILNALHFPCQLDFLIIPQCVSEYKIKHQHNVIHDYQQQCDELLFSIDGKNVNNIGKILSASQIQFKEFEIEREPAHFYKTLTRGFNKIQKKSWRKRFQRYIFIIDRRNPKFDGKYCLSNNEKTWKDKLYIYSPPKYNKISSQCDILPEGFINRTMQYLLPATVDEDNQDMVIGANCVANGYIFCESYHLYQEDKIKRYFHYNGYSQRFTKDELKYYFPRLFMKIDGKFQNELNIKNNQTSLAMFKEIEDEEHRQFHQHTMK